jgi:hypothetical protein
MLQFVGPSGDTLDIANPGSVDSVVFEKNVFYNRDGILEALATGDSIRLLKKTEVQISYENIGAYGMASPASAINNIKSLYVGSSLYNLSVNQNTVLDESIHWYLMDTRNNLFTANKANFLTLLPQTNRTTAAAYIQKKKISFEKEKDLLKLMNFLQPALH